MTQPTVSILVPVFNERESLQVLAGELREAMPDGISWDLLFVDDGSDDGSLEIARRLASEDDRTRVVSLSRNRGKTWAVQAGVEEVRGELVVLLDADLQYDAADVPRLLEASADCAGVCGVRVERDDPVSRKIASRCGNFLARIVTGTGFRDIGSGLQLYRRNWLLRVPWVGGIHRFLPPVVRLLGGRVREIPVRHRARRRGRSKYGNVGRLVPFAYDLARLWWLRVRNGALVADPELIGEEWASSDPPRR